MNEQRPSGTVTFLFTDIEGSTRLWADHPEGMAAALEQHDRVLRSTIVRHGGYVFSTGGDAFTAAFRRAAEAADAAVEAQQTLAAVAWPLPAPLQVRMGIHTGEAIERGGDYFGPSLNLAARVMSSAHGGQVVVTASAAGLLSGADLRDLGEFRLRDIDEPVRIFQLGGGEFGHLRSLDAYETSLPSYRSSFIGREREVERVRALLAKHRLVTVTGVGGCGKTRLAVEAAAEELPHFPDGVYFADLAPVSDEDDVPVAVARGLMLMLGGTSTPAEQVVRYLKPRKLLLVVDNCEHVIDAAAEIVDEALAGAPDVRVIATSREALGIDGEEAWRIPSLATAQQGQLSVSAQLFLERATGADADLVVPESDYALVEELCRRLDGIPLAIELAAARLRSMGLRELVDRLDDRFRLLTGGRRRAVQRQQTLAAAVAWSYDLLSAEEQAALRAMSVFVGPWDLDAAAPVTGQPATRATDVLDSLIAKSLVTTERTEDGRTRYRLLETIRQFAQEKLVEAEEVEGARDRHARHYERVARAGAGSVITLTPIVGANEENVLGAIEWLQGRDSAAALDLVILTLGLPEAAERAVSMLERFSGAEFAPEVRARARAFLPLGLLMAGRFVVAVGAALDGLSEFRGDATVEHFAVRHALAMLLAAVNPETSLRHATKSEEVYSGLSAGEQVFVGHMMLGGLGSTGAMALLHMREYDRAMEWCAARESAARLEDDGLTTAAAVALHLTGDHAGAALRAESVLQRRGQRRFGFGYLPEELLACCLAGMGEVERAGHMLVELARNNRLARIPLGISDAVTTFARVRFLAGDIERARTLLRCAVTRLVPMTPVLCETLAALEGWPDDEYVARMQQRVTELNRPERLENVDRDAWPLLQEEIAYFSGLSDRVTGAGVS